MKYAWLSALILLAVLLGGTARAVETENQGISVLPAPGPVSVDGKFDEWDLTGGIFSSSSPETQRDTFSTWTYAMYDPQNLYILVRWADETPMNNPGQTIADYGFAGDCMQMRYTLFPGTAEERTSHWTCWHGADGKDVMDVVYGKQFDGGNIKDAKTKGAKQAFAVNADGKGYVQEMSIPWALLTKDGVAPKAGETFTMTIEPNWTVGIGGRWSVKDIFKPGVTPDRVFTFMANQVWGPATLLAHGHIAPPSVRLSDGRLFPVKMAGGLEAVDWNGLIKTQTLKGFKNVSFTMPDDGYVSLNLKDSKGTVVRQLVNNAFYAKGEHTVLWDGLTTPNWRTPGDPVAAGKYTWTAIWHKAIGLRLRGWADNGGNAPWDNGPTTSWGGDEGVPVATASDSTGGIYLGWSGAEAGKALLALDSNGNVRWHNTRGGMGGASLVAADNGIVYTQNGGDIYKLSAADGKYVVYDNTDSPDLQVTSLFLDPKAAAASADALAVHAGKMYLSFSKINTLIIADAKTGKLIKSVAIQSPGAVKVAADGTAYILSAGTNVVALDANSGEIRTVIPGIVNGSALALDAAGRIYVGEAAPENQVKVFTSDGKPIRSIGRPGGRVLLGKWNPDGMAYISAITVASDGKLWVTEANDAPKRVSVWDTNTGAFVKEFFGPTSYGALGGAIDPLDPNVMVGQGCEWKLDPATGLSSCVAVITTEGMQNTRFVIGSNGRTYVAVASNWTFDNGPVKIFERLGAGEYKLRAEWNYLDKDGKVATGSNPITRTAYWADVNGDGLQQPDELTYADGNQRVSGWYMYLNPDFSFYAGTNQYKLTGFTACGAPTYDIANPVKMPIAGLGSADGKLVLTQGQYEASMSLNRCYDIASGKLIWTYPDNFVGVHGSHNAIPITAGMIRGSYGPTGSAKLPAPLGNIWVIPTNVGEWHILTEDGYYLTPLFQGDPLKVQWPNPASPGAIMDNTPPGLGGEDFGGSISYGKDGNLYIQAGKTGFWNLVVTGLDTVKTLGNGSVRVAPAEIKLAQEFHDDFAQEASGVKHMTIAKGVPTFTGDLDADFKGAQIIDYAKSSDASARSAAAWDAKNLYLAWDVKDNTPWTNGATDPTQMYVGGDTVDFQLGVDPKADHGRDASAAGDLRLSIGNVGGTATAVIYRKLSTVKKPLVFSSGVIKSYSMDYVSVLADATIKVTLKPGSGYVVEASIPLGDLSLAPSDGLALTGDFGVTYGDAAGQRTRLRSYWSNQHTGIVDDAVFELMLEPKNWGEITFAK